MVIASYRNCFADQIVGVKPLGVFFFADPDAGKWHGRITWPNLDYFMREALVQWVGLFEWNERMVYTWAESSVRRRSRAKSLILTLSVKKLFSSKNNDIYWFCMHLNHLATILGQVWKQFCFNAVMLNLYGITPLTLRSNIQPNMSKTRLWTWDRPATKHRK
jgi:hypothetical protein